MSQLEGKFFPSNLVISVMRHKTGTEATITSQSLFGRGHDAHKFNKE